LRQPSTPYGELRPFIVHGHDHKFRDMVVDHLRSIGLDEPVVLDGVASAGRTVIEKFEEESSKCNLALVLLTPDDQGRTSTGNLYNTARPNVWIELGYFIARFGRKSGKTILVYKRGLDIPTDLSGVLYIDATDSFSNADVAKRLDVELNSILIRGPLNTPTPPSFVSEGDLRIEGIVRFSQA